MTSAGFQRRGCKRGIALAALILGFASLAAQAQEGITKAPDWPNLLSEAGRRAAMALPKSSPLHLEPTLADLEDAQLAAQAESPSAKARYDAWIAAAGTPPNVRANDPTGDQGSPSADTQSELAVAAFGNNVVMAWNDSKGLRLGTPTTVTGYAYSTDGGATFTDGGSVPLIAVGDQSYGDATLDVDAAGNFYLGTIYLTAAGFQNCSVHRGTFSGSTFTWNTPVIAATVPVNTYALDKPYLCVDPANGNVYMSFTRFTTSVSIEVVRGTSLGTVWSAPVVLDTSSGIQGSRPYVGPEGYLYVAWQAGWGTINCDMSSTTGTIKLRRSTDPAGTFTFGAAVTVGTVQHNWTAYWAGNLRSNAIYFPDVAVDRSGGPYNGNVYVTWHEAVPWGAPSASGSSTAETEANDQANSVNVKTINPGDNATGTISTSGDLDYWKINVTAGQHIMLRLEPQGFSCGVSSTDRNFQLRLFKGVLGTAGDSILANCNLNRFASEIVFDAPETATYLFRVRNVNSSGTVTGTYTVKSRALTYGTPSPGRDMRDVVVARSTNQGVSFSTEVRVNDDAANLDNCIPAITVDNDGCVRTFFYDSRNASGARILRSYYQAVSSDGGLTWAPNQRISNQLQYFNLNTVAVPNYGEYNQACTAGGGGGGAAVYASWSDERLANANGSGVDAYVAKLTTCVTVSCAADQTAGSGDVLNLSMCVQNCGSFTDDFGYNVSDTQGWVVPGSATLGVAAGGSQCINVVCSVPPGTLDGTQTVITFSATAASCPAPTASCTTTITVQNPVTLPGAGYDCFQSTAQVSVILYGLGPGGTDYPTVLNLAGPAVVKRGNPVPLPPGFVIETEMVEMTLTGNDPLLGPVTLRESSLLASRGQVKTPPAPFYPAESFFDVFFEIHVPSAGMTVFNKATDDYKMSAIINAIPPVGSTYVGADMLLYRKGTNEGVPIGRVLNAAHTVGPVYACYPPPGVDCLDTTIRLVVDVPGFGVDVLQGSGPTRVSRGPAIDPGDGRLQFPTEIISMELSGVGALFGPFQMIEPVASPSVGLTKAQVPGTTYVADSFFDVFFEVSLPGPGIVAIPATPARMEAVISAVPPIGATYVLAAPVVLLDKTTLAPIGMLQQADHGVVAEVPCGPDPGMDCYEKLGQLIIDIAGVGQEAVNLSGLERLVHGPVYDLGGGQLGFDTELLQLEWAGPSILFGPVSVAENPSLPSTGRVTGQTVGTLWAADSFFDVFLEVSAPGFPAPVLRSQVPVRFATVGLPSWPIPAGTNFQPTNLPVNLVNRQNVVVGQLLQGYQIIGQPCPVVTDVVADPEAGSFYGLRLAYPNPFVNTTTVSLRLDRERTVRMQVYNVRGQLVRTVTNAALGAGLQILRWDGKDATGTAVTAGIYLYRIEVDGENVTRKVVKMQ